jgi:hypothetical protein
MIDRYDLTNVHAYLSTRSPLILSHDHGVLEGAWEAVGSRHNSRSLSVGVGDSKGVFSMCDYSLHNVKSRPAKVGDKLTTRQFHTGTRGFAAPEDVNTAVCVLPGTELAFKKEVRCEPRWLLSWKERTFNHATAIFRQINKDNPCTHHDALEFPDGQIVLLTDLVEGQEATVLQLPAQPAIAAEAEVQKRLALIS